MVVSYLDIFPRENGIVDLDEIVLLAGSGGLNPLQRFFRHIDITPDHWLWVGATNRSSNSRCARYGRFRLSSNPTVMVYPHRFMYSITHGPIPDGMEVHHKCYQSLCVQPDHLETQSVEFNHGDHAGDDERNEIPA